MDQSYLPRLDTSGKMPDTLKTEKGHLSRWKEAIGHLRLDRIRPHHVTGHLQRFKTKSRANRPCNLALVMLRHVLKSARVDSYLAALPVEGIPWQRVDKKARRLYTREDIAQFCTAAFKTRQNEKGETVPATKNA